MIELAGETGTASPRRRPTCETELLDPCAAALDQDNQNDNDEYSCNNPNDRGGIHIDSSFLQ
jgi:hypothetical protein